MSFIPEFKSFAMKGNVIDMAVGIIMPPIGMLIVSYIRNPSFYSK